MIERQTGIALWRQIADRMRLAINNGDFDDTGMMPPETTLAAQFGVNRHTVRSALASLADEGLVRGIQGIGTRIERRDSLTFPISRRTRFSRGLGDQASETEGRLLEQATEVASPVVAKALGLASGASCIRLETLSTADRRPISRSTGYFPADRFAGIGELYQTTGSITRAFEKLGVEDYVRRSTEISATHAEAEDLQDLKLSPGAILLVTTAINTDMAGKPIQFSRSRFAADRVKFTVDI
ncbi:phosphonate metabolism transcriptional regulator PhnF [Sinorhizobium sp. BG8]|uniref:phosphonate metabolism transcriptional regulator PhnF n=1 Tax=Sinorhizobium sp. BG8 TaxID=2613773 RepID=UPI00193D6CFC|nr:phosphonate metabolism transcriptional regulator PhnF [Sinorhizobium sp. BG8]QRM54320.1 phosphonate metabolism transcriptional regulator PhnF [Sinorhizobium sp. BG8]